MRCCSSTPLQVRGAQRQQLLGGCGPPAAMPAGSSTAREPLRVESLQRLAPPGRRDAAGITRLTMIGPSVTPRPSKRAQRSRGSLHRHLLQQRDERTLVRCGVAQHVDHGLRLVADRADVDELGGRVRRPQEVHDAPGRRGVEHDEVVVEAARPDPRRCSISLTLPISSTSLIPGAAVVANSTALLFVTSFATAAWRRRTVERYSRSEASGSTASPHRPGRNSRSLTSHG